MIQQPVAMPLDLRDTTQGGKIYTPDPAAVARLRAILEDERQTRPTPLQSGTEKQLQPAVKRGGIKRNAAGVDTDLAERAEKLKAMREAKAAEAKEQECDMPHKIQVTDEQLLALYRRYVLDRETLDDLSAGAPISRAAIGIRFKKMNYPCRGRGGCWQPGDIERVARVLSVPISLIPGEVGDETAVSPSLPVLNTEHAETAVSPTGNVASDLPAPAHCGSDLAVMRDQLAALTALLETAQAKSVNISGRIRLELTAEIEL